MKNATLIRIQKRNATSCDLIAHLFENSKLVQTLTLNAVDWNAAGALEQFLGQWSQGHVARITHEI